MNQYARDAALFMDHESHVQDFMLDIEVSYRNAPDTREVSDTFKIDISVVPSSQSTGRSAILPVILLAVIIIGAGYYLLVMRKKN